MAPVLDKTEDRARVRPKADATITMRLPEQMREIIDTAAAAIGKSRTEFMLDSARQTAIKVLLDQRVFHLDAAASEAFADALSRPSPQALSALVQAADLMRDNRDAIDACRKSAATSRQPVRCTVKIRAESEACN